jgi:hypothetical protein
MLEEAMLDERAEEGDVVRESQEKPSDQRSPSDPTESEYEYRQRPYGCSLTMALATCRTQEVGEVTSCNTHPR